MSRTRFLVFHLEALGGGDALTSGLPIAAGQVGMRWNIRKEHGHTRIK